MLRLSQCICVFVFVYCICNCTCYLLCVALYENTKKEKDRNVGRVKGCLGQSGIDAPAKSVSPQSVACPVTHTRAHKNTNTNCTQIHIQTMHTFPVYKCEAIVSPSLCKCG